MYLITEIKKTSATYEAKSLKSTQENKTVLNISNRGKQKESQLHKYQEASRKIMKISDCQMQKLSLELEEKKTAAPEIRHKERGALCPSSEIGIKEQQAHPMVMLLPDTVDYQMKS